MTLPTRLREQAARREAVLDAIGDPETRAMAAQDVADLREVVDAVEWRPIETAPINVSVLIWLSWAEHYGPGIYRAIHVVTEYSDRWHTTGVAIGRDLNWDRPPTRWMPIPAPPVAP